MATKSSALGTTRHVDFFIEGRLLWEDRRALNSTGCEFKEQAARTDEL
jgi:hypothetical protein